MAHIRTLKLELPICRTDSWDGQYNHATYSQMCDCVGGGGFNIQYSTPQVLATIISTLLRFGAYNYMQNDYNHLYLYWLLNYTQLTLLLPQWGCLLQRVVAFVSHGSGGGWGKGARIITLPWRGELETYKYMS